MPSEITVRNRGLRVLGSQTTAIADITLVSMQASEPAYRRIVNPAELQIARSAAEMLETCRLPHEERMGATGWPTEVGRRRAQQGVPLEAMLRAYHIGGQALFDAFMEWAVEEGIPRERSIILANDLWHVVDLHCAAAATAFRAAEEEMFGGRRAGELLDALLGGDADRDCVTGVMRAWGWAEQARYAVVVCRPADWGAPPLEPAELPARTVGIRVVWRVNGGCAVGVAPLGDISTSAFAKGLPTRSGRRVGVSLAVDSLADVGRARRLAELAARTVAGGDGVACLEERLPAAMLVARPDLARELCTRVLAPVLALDRVSRDLLLDTLAAWLAGGGSAHRAALSLFCHRNTVLNRMRRLERLTKRSLAVPEDLVELALALEAFQMHAVRT